MEILRDSSSSMFLTILKTATARFKEWALLCRRHTHESSMRRPGSATKNQLKTPLTEISCVLAKLLWNPLPHGKPPVSDLACLWSFHRITWYKHEAFVPYCHTVRSISPPQISGESKQMLCQSSSLLWFCVLWWEEHAVQEWMIFFLQISAFSQDAVYRTGLRNLISAFLHCKRSSDLTYDYIYMWLLDETFVFLKGESFQPESNLKKYICQSQIYPSTFLGISTS